VPAPRRRPPSKRSRQHLPQHPMFKLAARSRTSRVVTTCARGTASGMGIAPAGTGGTCSAAALATNSRWTGLRCAGPRGRKSALPSAGKRWEMKCWGRRHSHLDKGYFLRRYLKNFKPKSQKKFLIFIKKIEVRSRCF
jgi:hypothetical protein